MSEDLVEALECIIARAAVDGYFTASGERVMLALVDLEKLGCNVSITRDYIMDKIKEFELANPIEEV